MAYRGRILLLNETGLTASVTTEPVQNLRPKRRQFMGRLACINQSGTGPTLDAKIQTANVRDGIYSDFLVFTQVTTTTGLITDLDNIEDAEKDPNSGQPFTWFRLVLELSGTDPVYDLIAELFFD